MSMTSDSTRDGSWRRCPTRSARRPTRLFPSRFCRSDAAEADGNRTRQAARRRLYGFEDRGAHQEPRRLRGQATCGRTLRGRAAADRPAFRSPPRRERSFPRRWSHASTIVVEQARTAVRAHQGQREVSRGEHEACKGDRSAHREQGTRASRRIPSAVSHVDQGHLVRSAWRASLAPRSWRSHEGAALPGREEAQCSGPLPDEQGAAAACREQPVALTRLLTGRPVCPPSRILLV
jgi:hypothetical protein